MNGQQGSMMDVGTIGVLGCLHEIARRPMLGPSQGTAENAQVSNLGLLQRARDMLRSQCLVSGFISLNDFVSAFIPPRRLVRLGVGQPRKTCCLAGSPPPSTPSAPFSCRLDM